MSDKRYVLQPNEATNSLDLIDTVEGRCLAMFKQNDPGVQRAEEIVQTMNDNEAEYELLRPRKGRFERWLEGRSA